MTPAALRILRGVWRSGWAPSVDEAEGAAAELATQPADPLAARARWAARTGQRDCAIVLTSLAVHRSGPGRLP